MASESTSAALARKAAMLRSAGRATSGREGVRVSIADHSAAGGLGFDRVFVGLGALHSAMPGALTAILPTIRGEFDRNFTTQGSSGRGAWAGLKPATQRERIRLGYSGPGPILQRAGTLRRFVLTAPGNVSGDDTGFTLRIAPGDSVGGVRKYRALALGHGSTPGRPMVTVGPAGATRITSELSRLLRRIAGV